MSKTIYHIIPSFHPVIGGAERQLERLARVQRETGKHVKIITRNLDSKDLLPRDFKNIEIIRLNSINMFFFNVLLFLFFLKNFNQIKFVHVHSCSSVMFTSFFCSFFLNFKAFIKITRIGSGSQLELIKNNFFKRSLFNLFKNNKKIKFIALTDEAKDYFLNFFNDFSINVIPNGIDVSKFQIIEIKEAINIIFISRLISRKNVFNSVKIIHESFKFNYNVAICGNGSEYLKIKNYIKTNTLSNINLFGELNENEIFNNLSKSHFFILNSINEGLSNAFLEAISAGVVPVVSENEFYVKLNLKYDCLLFFDDFIKFSKKELIKVYYIKSKNLKLMLNKDFNIINIAEKLNDLYAS